MIKGLYEQEKVVHHVDGSKRNNEKESIQVIKANHFGTARAAYVRSDFHREFIYNARTDGNGKKPAS